MRTTLCPSSRFNPSALALVAIALAVNLGFGAGNPSYGRLTGMVTDRQGHPLVDATVVIVGPGITRRVESVLTDTHGRFTAGDLLPGRYSLRVASTSLVRDGVEVQPGQISELSLILHTILPQAIRQPNQGAARSADDWKWVLRTASSVRPVLRYHASGADNTPTPLDPSQKLVAMMPGAAGEDTLSDQTDLGSVFAYWRPVSRNADILVASSMAGQGVSSSSVITSFRRKAADGAPQELTLVVHQLNFGDGVQILSPAGPDLSSGHGMTLGYAETRQLSSALRLSSGFEINYLDAFGGAFTVEPRADLEYLIGPASSLEVTYTGSPASDGDGTLAEKVDELNAFPRVSLRNNGAHLEAAHHSEVAYSRRVGRKTKVQVAAYHDGFSNAVVRGFGPAGAWSQLAASGDVLPNATGDGVNLNAGNYGSSGVRASVSEDLTRHLQAGAVYSTGDALAVLEAARGAAPSFSASIHSRSSQSAAGKLVAELPATKTQVVASYAWVEHGSVTAVDPYGLEDLDIAPYAGLQIRQPLPRIGFLPTSHIQAVADFRNVGGEGYVRVAGAHGQTVVLTPAYRSFRGGFEVQF